MSRKLDKSQPADLTLEESCFSGKGKGLDGFTTMLAQSYPCKTWIKDNFQKSTFGLRVGGATHHYHYLGIGAFVEVCQLCSTNTKNCGARSVRREGKFSILAKKREIC